MDPCEGAAPRDLYDGPRYTMLPVMGTSAARRKPPARDANVLVRFDRESKSLVRRAAALKGLTMSDYVRSRLVPVAREEIEEAASGVLRLEKKDQIALWRALSNPPKPNAAQKALGRLVRSVM